MHPGIGGAQIWHDLDDCRLTTGRQLSRSESALPVLGGSWCGVSPASVLARTRRWYSPHLAGATVGESENRNNWGVMTLAAKHEPEPQLTARVKVRPKAQLTLPEEIRRALHIGEGDEVEFAVHDDGTVTVRGFISIPTDQAWFFTPDWLAGEREADEQIAAGSGQVFHSADEMFAHLDALGGGEDEA